VIDKTAPDDQSHVNVISITLWRGAGRGRGGKSAPDGKGGNLSAVFRGKLDY